MMEEFLDLNNRLLSLQGENLSEFNDSDIFDRHREIPGHVQAALNRRIVIVGAGGLGSWIAAGLLRCGARNLIICDDDEVTISNLPRQYFFKEDLGRPKGVQLANNLIRHSTAQTKLIGLGMSFQDVIENYVIPCDLLVIGVDNNPARLAAASFARSRRIPATFVALSTNGMRINAFLQGPRNTDACWHCVHPDLDPAKYSPCAASIISTCFMAAGIAIFLSHRALMGWPDGVTPFNWYDHDLLGQSPSYTGLILQRDDCPTCGKTS